METYNDSEVLHAMALASVLPMNYVVQNALLNALGTATAVWEHRHDIRDAVPEASARLCEPVAQLDTALSRCEAELRFAERGCIACIPRTDKRYPQRLLSCDDAPILLYYRGNADLNTARMVSMVGTRHCTEYGKDLCRRFVGELKELIPEVVIVSGLAYGIDINAHRAALAQGIPTIGVLAHGLDQIYPRPHRDTAVEMVGCGGLLTEYMSHTNADKKNFVARNRIVAGMCDATVVVESASRGGSLITARIAGEYNREVFAYPGRVSDSQSAGCNMLLQRGEAHLLTSASDLAAVMGWHTHVQEMRQRGIQREFFVELTPEEQRIVEALRGSDGKQVNQLCIDAGMSINELSSLLFELEMRGVVRLMSGGMYRVL